MWLTRLKSIGASLLGSSGTDPRPASSPPNWLTLPLNVDNLNSNPISVGKTGSEQIVRLGVFALAGPNAPVLRIDRIAEDFVGQEIGMDAATGGYTRRRVTEATLHAELAGEDGARKTLVFHPTNTPNLFERTIRNGATMQPFIAGAESGHGTVRLSLDPNGYPVELILNTGLTPLHVRFTGFGTFPERPLPPSQTVDAFT